MESALEAIGASEFSEDGSLELIHKILRIKVEEATNTEFLSQLRTFTLKNLANLDKKNADRSIL